MTDYAVKVSIRNGRILRRMQECGIASQTELARLAGVAVVTVNALVTMRKLPVNGSGQWYPGVENIAGVLQCDPDDLFTDRQRQIPLLKNSHETFMAEADVARLADNSDLEASVWARIESQRLLSVLPAREREVMEARMGGEELKVVAAREQVTVERIRQIEAKAMSRMRKAADRSAGATASKMVWSEMT